MSALHNGVLVSWAYYNSLDQQFWDSITEMYPSYWKTAPLSPLCEPDEGVVFLFNTDEDTIKFQKDYDLCQAFSAPQ